VIVKPNHIRCNVTPSPAEPMPLPGTVNLPPEHARQTTIADFWERPATIEVNNFNYKSLSNWSLNTCVGCFHGCRFCYVPSTSANKLAPKLGALGVHDPDEEWGLYAFIRKWDEKAFLSSLRKAEQTPVEALNPDGNRAVMLCSTTDAYQVIRHRDPEIRRRLQQAHRHIVRRSLELIRDQSSLNVRILTRGPLAKTDFDLMRSFGPRLLFGMSLPTLNDRLAKIYEPGAPSVSRRLETLRAAKEAGLNIFVAMAPTYPECDELDLRATLGAIKELEPATIFHEPINIRAENVARIATYAADLGIAINTGVFDTVESWEDYALGQLHAVERIATKFGLGEQLHLWPDKSFGTKRSLSRFQNPATHLVWLQKCWDRVSEWPGKSEG
jgi:DNA repair photolyase